MARGEDGRPVASGGWPGTQGWSATPAWTPRRLPSSDQAALTASRTSWPSSTSARTAMIWRALVRQQHARPWARPVCPHRPSPFGATLGRPSLAAQEIGPGWPVAGRRWTPNTTVCEAFPIQGWERQDAAQVPPWLVPRVREGPVPVAHVDRIWRASRIRGIRLARLPPSSLLPSLRVDTARARQVRNRRLKARGRG